MVNVKDLSYHKCELVTIFPDLLIAQDEMMEMLLDSQPSLSLKVSAGTKAPEGGPAQVAEPSWLRVQCKAPRCCSDTLPSLLNHLILSFD